MEAFLITFSPTLVYGTVRSYHAALFYPTVQ
jgi:hypothetical protein